MYRCFTIGAHQDGSHRAVDQVEVLPVTAVHAGAFSRVEGLQPEVFRDGVLLGRRHEGRVRAR